MPETSTYIFTASSNLTVTASRISFFQAPADLINFSSVDRYVYYDLISNIPTEAPKALISHHLQLTTLSPSLPLSLSLSLKPRLTQESDSFSRPSSSSPLPPSRLPPNPRIYQILQRSRRIIIVGTDSLTVLYVRFLATLVRMKPGGKYGIATPPDSAVRKYNLRIQRPRQRSRLGMDGAIVGLGLIGFLAGSL